MKIFGWLFGWFRRNPTPYIACEVCFGEMFRDPDDGAYYCVCGYRSYVAAYLEADRKLEEAERKLTGG